LDNWLTVIIMWPVVAVVVLSTTLLVQVATVAVAAEQAQPATEQQASPIPGVVVEVAEAILRLALVEMVAAD
jgi:hypothetical protein